MLVQSAFEIMFYWRQDRVVFNFITFSDYSLIYTVMLFSTKKHRQDTRIRLGTCICIL